MRDHEVLVLMLFALLVVFTMPGDVVSAHHSMAGYDMGKVIILEGVVSEYTWRNPHVWVVWEVKDDRGKAVRWIGELPAINTDLSLGMTKNSLKAGDEVAVTANPSKLGTPEGRVMKIVKKDGTVVMDLDRRGVVRLLGVGCRDRRQDQCRGNCRCRRNPVRSFICCRREAGGFGGRQRQLCARGAPRQPA